MSLIFVNKTSFANSYLFVNNSKPSNEINESLPQSRNHGYPAIAEYVLNNGLFIISKLLTYQVSCHSFYYFELYQYHK